ncbi:leucine-rich repeat domain-containing protein [Algibacter lectus]|uniref:leucine-rich repeat domain-containing protein n=1 Tax=Algibacter lectus TaxID=221126 RepID=UPI000943CF1B|nr:leucine-rich repeat domain-containing protein [Algibacter lectus]
MNWNNYLSESKSPSDYPHLGILEGTVRCPFDISELPTNSEIIDMPTPLKKFKLNYFNYEHLIGNKVVEGIILNDLDKERLNVIASLPNLKYLNISNNKQDAIPNLSVLKSLEVLILSGITKVENINFIANLENLKTLYIYGIKNLYELKPLTTLPQLKELWLDHGRMGGTGKAVKNIEPLSELNNLEYLNMILNVENKNYDISPLLNLKKLKHLRTLPRFMNKEKKETLEMEIPLVKII